MRRLAIIVVVLLVGAGIAAADYVSYFGTADLSGGYYRYDYRYHHDLEGPDLIPGETSWTLDNVAGLDDPFASSAGAVYWDGGTFSNDNTAVTWFYTGTDPDQGDDDGQSTYGLFQIIVYHPSGHVDDIPYEITDPDTTGEVPGPTPEPGTLLLCAVGLGALISRRRRS